MLVARSSPHPGLAKLLEIVGGTIFTLGAGPLMFAFAVALTRLGDGVPLKMGFYKVMLIGLALSVFGIWVLIVSQRLRKRPVG